MVCLALFKKLNGELITTGRFREICDFQHIHPAPRLEGAL
jgi:hypothetical protein